MGSLSQSPKAPEPMPPGAGLNCMAQERDSNNSTQKRRNTSRETRNTQRYRARLKAAGLCPVCRGEQDTDRYRCSRCNEARRDAALFRMASGHCTLCGVEKPPSRHTTCSDCRLYHRVYMRDYLAKYPERKQTYYVTGMLPEWARQKLGL